MDLNSDTDAVCRLRSILCTGGTDWPRLLGQRLEMIVGSAEVNSATRREPCGSFDSVQNYLDECFSLLCRSINAERESRLFEAAEYMASAVRRGQCGTYDIKPAVSELVRSRRVLLASDAHPLDLIDDEEANQILQTVAELLTINDDEIDGGQGG